jgi:alanyl-tRNA synthetase
MINAQEIRQKYLEFFRDKGHVIVPRANVVPSEDATTLFTGSGMQPMVPFLLGEEHPEGNRLVNSQLCIRVEDIEEVGDDSHTTSFEMLGNWSLGDYFQAEQIPWIAEFLFDVVGLDPSRVYATCYIGNDELDIPKDNPAIELWKTEFSKRGINAEVVDIGTAENGDKVGMQGGRIFLYDGNENWWSRGGAEDKTPMGDPCGPDSEMFFDFGEQYHDEAKWGKAHPASDSSRFFEIGNNVFMAYRRTENGMEPLEHKNIDHGSGLERIAAAVLDTPDVFKISLFWPIIEELEKITGKKYDDHKPAMRVIADHLKGAMFMAVDGVVPSNNEQGYVARRLMRRAIRFAFDLGIEHDLVIQILPKIVEVYEDMSDVIERADEVSRILSKEEKVFRGTLRKGEKEVEKILEHSEKLDDEGKKVLTGADVFKLYDTYGYPKELTKELVEQKGAQLSSTWQQELETAMNEQRERSRTATKGQFKGGLGGDSLIHKKYHTATHLMYERFTKRTR